MTVNMLGYFVHYLLQFFVLLQNDFNFEKRDWMRVESAELAEGSKLVRKRAQLSQKYPSSNVN